MLQNSDFRQLPVSQRKSGLLIPKGAEVSSANEKIAEQYEKDAINHAVTLMKDLAAEEVASFLFTKHHSAVLIAGIDSK